jgi:hypothetical protein
MAINTLVTIRDAIQAFVDGHKQLERVEFGADDKRAPKITESDLFPMLYVAPLDVEVGRAHNTHRLRIYVYERLNDASQDEWENANDTSLMLRDIRVWWNDYGVDDILIEEDPTGTFKTDGELDKVVGYFAEFRFQIPSHGRCDVPINVTPQPPVSGCLPANYVVEYADGTPIQSGEIPSGQSEIIVVPNCEPCPPCENATYVLTVGGNAVDSGEIGSGQTEEIPIDAFIPTCEDAAVEINGTFFDTVPSGDTLNVLVKKSTGNDLIGSKQGQFWRIGDSSITLRDTANNTLITTNVKATESTNITAPDGTVTVNRDGVFFADVDVTSGGGASLNVPSICEPDFDSESFITNANITDTTQQSLIRQLVSDLKTQGLWAKLQVIYIFIGGNATAHRLNLRNAQDSNGAFRLTFFGGWTHSATGAIPNGTNGYADTNFRPAQLVANNDFHIMVNVRNINTGTTRFHMGVDSSSQIGNGTSLGRVSSGTRDVGLIAGNSTQYTPSATLTPFVGSKIVTVNGSRSARYFANGVFQNNAVTQAADLANANIFLGALSVGGSPSFFDNCEFSFATMGLGLTDAEALALHNIQLQFNTALGR